jgi:hypothetical protein
MEGLMDGAIKENLRRSQEIEGYSKAFSKLLLQPSSKFRRLREISSQGTKFEEKEMHLLNL